MSSLKPAFVLQGRKVYYQALVFRKTGQVIGYWSQCACLFLFTMCLKALRQTDLFFFLWRT